MKQYIFKAMLFSAASLAVLTSCEFDQYPETSIPNETAWSTMTDARQFEEGLHSATRGICGGAYANIAELQSDLFNETNANWEGGTYSNQDWKFTSSSYAGDAVWQGCFAAVANANNVINNIDKIRANVDTTYSIELDYIKGEAYFLRALAYDKLARRYTKAYDKTNAENLLGLPLITEVDVNAKPSRANLKETYDFIKNDVAQAKTLMSDASFSDRDYETSKISYDVADALDARVSLNCQDYAHAVECAERLINKYPLCSDASSFAEMWSSDTGSEIIFQPAQTVDERTNTYGCYIMYSTKAGMLSPDNVPTQGLIDLYGDINTSTDIRLTTYFTAEGAIASEIVDENVITFNKFPGNQSLVKSNPLTEYYNMTKEFRTGEMYLIAAEAAYQNGDEAASLSYLNKLRSGRQTTQLNVSGNMLFSNIKDEWAREMCGEGFRLDCLKRWGMGCKRMTAQSCVEGYLRSQDGYQNLDVPATDKRFVWEIPVNDTQANKNLQHNWTEE